MVFISWIEQFNSFTSLNVFETGKNYLNLTELLKLNEKLFFLTRFFHLKFPGLISNFKNSALNIFHLEIPDKIDFLSVMKSTEIFGSISLLYKTMSFGEY
jgi:hypothetical protein